MFSQEFLENDDQQRSHRRYKKKGSMLFPETFAEKDNYPRFHRHFVKKEDRRRLHRILEKNEQRHFHRLCKRMMLNRVFTNISYFLPHERHSETHLPSMSNSMTSPTIASLLSESSSITSKSHPVKPCSRIARPKSLSCCSRSPLDSVLVDCVSLSAKRSDFSAKWHACQDDKCPEPIALTLP